MRRIVFICWNIGLVILVSTGKTSSDCLRGYGSSRHNGGSIKAPPPLTSQYDSAVMVRGISGGPSEAEKCQSLEQLCVCCFPSGWSAASHEVVVTSR